MKIDNPITASIYPLSFQESNQHLLELIDFIPKLEEKIQKFQQGLLPNEKLIKAFRDQLAFSCLIYDWPSFQAVAQNYYDNPHLSTNAPLKTIMKLLTLRLGKDRFCDRHLDEMIYSGHMLQILSHLREICSNNHQF